MIDFEFTENDRKLVDGLRAGAPIGNQKRDAGELNENAADFAEGLGAESFRKPAAESRIHGFILDQPIEDVAVFVVLDGRSVFRRGAEPGGQNAVVDGLGR